MTAQEVPAAGWVPADTFGARLALLRQSMGGWNVKKMADYCGLNDQTWRSWEAGSSSPQDFEKVADQIAESTGCNRVWLVAGEVRIGSR